MKEVEIDIEGITIEYYIDRWELVVPVKLLDGEIENVSFESFEHLERDYLGRPLRINEMKEISKMDKMRCYIEGMDLQTLLEFEILTLNIENIKP